MIQHYDLVLNNENQKQIRLRLTLILHPRLLTNLFVHENLILDVRVHYDKLYLYSLLNRDNNDNLNDYHLILNEGVLDKLLLLRLERATRELGVTTMRIRRVKLRTNRFRPSTIVLTLLNGLFLIYLISSLVHTIAYFLRRLINVASGVVATRVYTVRSLFQLLIYFPSSVLARPLNVSRHTLRRVTIDLMTLRFLIRALVLNNRLDSLTTRLLDLVFVLLRLLLCFVRRAIRLFNPMTTSILFGLYDARVLQNRRDNFLPFRSVLGGLSSQSIFFTFSKRNHRTGTPLTTRHRCVALVRQNINAFNERVISLRPTHHSPLAHLPTTTVRRNHGRDIRPREKRNNYLHFTLYL